MTPKTKGKKVSTAMDQKEFKATLKRIDSNLKRIEANRRKSKMSADRMAPKLKALEKFIKLDT